MPSIFTDKDKKPDSQLLKKTIGEAFNYWLDIKTFVDENFGLTTEEWKYYNQKSGWILKLFLKKRNLLFFAAQENYFRISFVFGDKAVAVVEKSDLPAEIINELKSARKYAEGRGISFEVRDHGPVESIKKLLEIKINN
jgi:Protein of unknown function (DUF3788)